MIQNCDNLYCLGNRGCAVVSQIRYVNIIWGMGNRALWTSNIIDIFGDIYCAAYQSCADSTITNVINGNVYGRGYQGLHSAVISNVNGTVFGYGKQVLQLASITNATNVLCLVRCFF